MEEEMLNTEKKTEEEPAIPPKSITAARINSRNRSTYFMLSQQSRPMDDDLWSSTWRAKKKWPFFRIENGANLRLLYHVNIMSISCRYHVDIMSISSYYPIQECRYDTMSKINSIVNSFNRK
jgi:hypothetical protein